MKTGAAASILLLALTAAATAGEPWILALPPLVEPAKRDAAVAEAKSEPSGPDRTRSLINAIVDRAAPIQQWEKGPQFDGGAACEDARLARLQEYDAAVDALDRSAPTSGDLERLTKLGREAFSRCVPAFASSPGQASHSS